MSNISSLLPIGEISYLYSTIPFIYISSSFDIYIYRSYCYFDIITSDCKIQFKSSFFVW